MSDFNSSAAAFAFIGEMTQFQKDPHYRTSSDGLLGVYGDLWTEVAPEGQSTLPFDACDAAFILWHLYKTQGLPITALSPDQAAFLWEQSSLYASRIDALIDFGESDLSGVFCYEHLQGNTGDLASQLYQQCYLANESVDDVVKGYAQVQGWVLSAN